jgi:hypothetical protein
LLLAFSKNLPVLFVIESNFSMLDQGLFISTVSGNSPLRKYPDCCAKRRPFVFKTKVINNSATEMKIRLFINYFIPVHKSNVQDNKDMRSISVSFYFFIVKMVAEFGFEYEMGYNYLTIVRCVKWKLTRRVMKLMAAICKNAAGFIIFIANFGC